MSIIMDMYNIKWTQLQAGIFRFLCMKAGKSFNLREISRALKKSPTAISNAIKQLAKGEIVVVEKSKGLNLLSIKFNRDNPKAIEYKRVENLKIFYESGLLNILKEKFPGSTIILFGSYSKGEDIISSDIDLAIIGSKEKEVNLASYDKLFERKITINFYPSFKDIHKHLFENILNGILLNGGIEL